MLPVAVFGVPVRIACIGDSVTQADSTHRSYRYNLWKKLIDAGAEFDFVGSMTTNFNGSPSWPNYSGQIFDRNHEGHWGKRADEILATLPGWLASYTPDVALIHLGTNDIIQGQTAPSTVQDISAIIDVLRTDNPKVVVLLAQVIPYLRQSPHFAANSGNLPALNSGLAGLAATRNTVQSPVVIVDQYTGFSPSTETYDSVHPNELGEEKMALKWMQFLSAHLPGPPLTIDADVVPDATQFVNYSSLLQASGGNPPYSWALADGSVLPDSLDLAAGGELGGVPQVTGEFSFSVEVTDASQTTFSKSFTLRVASALENWREFHFQSTENSGDSANGFDFDHDGMVNLVEYAFGLDPKIPDRHGLPQAVRTESGLVYQFSPPSGVTGITYRAEWNTALTGEWTPVSSTGAGPELRFSVPTGNHGRLFLRLVVVAP